MQKKPVAPLLKSMKIGDTIEFDIPRSTVVKSTIYRLGDVGLKFFNEKKDDMLHVTRIK